MGDRLATLLRLDLFDGLHVVRLELIERHLLDVVIETAGIAENLDRLRRLEAIAVLLVDPIARLPQRLAAELVEERLVTPAEGGVSRSEFRPPKPEQNLPYESPELVVYRDMADLLALDPPVPGLEYTPWE